MSCPAVLPTERCGVRLAGNVGAGLLSVVVFPVVALGLRERVPVARD